MHPHDGAVIDGEPGIASITSGDVVLDDALVHGPHGYAGAIGPLPVPANPAFPEPDGQSPTVPLPKVASRHVLNEMAEDAGLDPARILANGTSCEFAAVRDWADRSARALAVAVISSVSTFDFEAVVVDGDLPPDVREYLMRRLSKCLDEQEFTGLFRPELIVGNLGNRGRTLGGALLPFHSNFAPERDLLVKPQPGGLAPQ